MNTSSVSARLYTFTIRNVNSIRKQLTSETVAIVTHALITSRIDNGNSLLTGISERLLGKLQLAQNAAARNLTRQGNLNTQLRY